MKKITALILTLILITAIAPMNAFAIEPDKVVENIEITLDPKIAGKSPADCAEFLTVSGEGITFDESSFKAIYTKTPQLGYSEEAEVFEEGVHYISDLYIYPAEGYILPYHCENINIKYTILRSNGTAEGSFQCTPEDHYDIGVTGYYKIKIFYTVEAQEPEGIARIPFLIGKFFDSIAIFFTETFIQPIIDLIMKI